ncbi:DUF5691 domain-containing protein [Streptomyces noursei]|nr:DUF5691 domain-containing protein [Streptomyces noursei]
MEVRPPRHRRAAVAAGRRRPRGGPAAVGGGLFAERVALLTSLRRRDPRAGLALLAATWATERAEDRLMFLDSLGEALTPSDEPFLEQALSDRSRNVRTTAAELLSALPGSALAARMAERSLVCVRLARPAPGTPPPPRSSWSIRRAPATPGCSGTASPPAALRKGERAWWLGQLVEATPLDRWLGRLGRRSPAELVALPVAGDWRTELHDAWCRAAVRQRHADWARALLGAPGDPGQAAAELAPAGSSRI